MEARGASGTRLNSERPRRPPRRLAETDTSATEAFTGRRATVASQQLNATAGASIGVGGLILARDRSDRRWRHARGSRHFSRGIGRIRG
jgi:hypothetical protein